MNLARKFLNLHHHNVGKSSYRKFRFSALNYESTQATQPKVQEEKFDFEDLKVLERTERRKAKIEPFMKNVFVSIFDRELLAYPEILNKEETEALDQRAAALEKVFFDANKTKEDRIQALKRTKMYAAPLSLTNNGLAVNYTESLRYLEIISSDTNLGQEMSEHWVGLEALKKGLEAENFQNLSDDISSGEYTISLCIKERIAERITQADFRTSAEMDEYSVWRVNGEKVCHKADGYLLVLCTVEGSRLRAFLVHPRAEGVTTNGTFVTFRKTPAVPLNMISEQALAQTLGASRLHAATLTRCSLRQAMQACVDYIRPRAFSGRPLSELSTIRATIGDALVNIYASESAEYFTAGLLDGYLEPEAELEMAMCRNFIANHGLTSILQLLSIPALEKEEECKRLLDNMRHLASHGESLESINMFIALNGLHHAGKMMAEEVRQVRNPLMHPTFIFKKVFANRHQERDDPKLNLHLAEHLHPTLRPPSDQLEYCVLRMKYACETLMNRYGLEAATAFTELTRLAQAGTEILVMAAVLARASRSYCIGVRNAEVEMKIAACFVDQAKDRVKKLILDIDNGEYLNLDHFRVQFGKRILDSKSAVVERPTTRVFW